MSSAHNKPTLKLDWCSHEAAKYAVEHWHYSRSLPGASKVYLGVWEDHRFIGVIVFGLGSGSVTNGNRYGLKKSHEMAELCRVALSSHVTSVSRILSIAIKLLKKQSPDIKLLISFADPMQAHVGGIYQAMGWIYTGTSKPDVQYFQDGKWRHHRSATSRTISVAGLPSKKLLAKHRYLWPMDLAMPQRIAPLAKPYPKRAKDQAAPDQGALGGETPTRTLQHTAR